MISWVTPREERGGGANRLNINTVLDVKGAVQRGSSGTRDTCINCGFSKGKKISRANKALYA